jgi:hypothetical protein
MTEIPGYTPDNWHWQLTGDDRFWSSVLGAFVDDLPEGAPFTRINDAASLTEVLANQGLRGPMVYPADVHAERDRRLALGFDFDFGAERGVHRFATTPGDMVGWQDVTTWATVQAVTGNETVTLPIKTETGPTVVTAAEWFAVLNTATAFRQPIWAASFVLEAMDPIPADFRQDSYWTR